jgi:hypothetical protein
MRPTYLVRKDKDGIVWLLMRVCDDGAVERLVNGKWLPEPNEFYVSIGELGDDITAEEAREIAPQFGGTIELDDTEASERS